MTRCMQAVSANESILCEWDRTESGSSSGIVSVETPQPEAI